ncbi:MAG: hypothetical protein EPN88_13300, partial [Bacteroidetes bacterium]
LQPDAKGKTEYISLASRLDSISEIRLIYSIVVQNKKVLFLSAKFIYIYDIINDSLTKINLLKFNLIDALRMVKINDKIIIADNVGGLFELTDTIISPLPGGDFFRKKNCLALLQYDESKILIGTFYDGLYLYDYKTGVVKNNFISDKINEKLKKVSVYAGAKLKDDLFAVGTTTEEGILVFNKTGVMVQQIKKENSALEDNTIYSMYCDYKNNSELWISTYGVISKAYFNIPLSEFTEKQGIESGVNEICEFQGNSYISSDAGVLKSYVNDQNYVEYKKVPGINTQVFPLEVINSPTGDILLAGSLNGLIQISKNDRVINVESICTGLSAKQITKLNVKKILQSSIDRKIVYFGLDAGGLVILKYDGARWYFINGIKNLSGIISGIVEKKEGGLWFLTDDPSSLYSLNVTPDDTVLVKYGPDKGIPDLDMNSIHYLNNELYITSASGILKYDKSADKFVIDNSLTGGYSDLKYSHNLFLDDEGDLWFSGIDNTRIEMLFRKNNTSIVGYTGVLRLLPNVPLMDIRFSEGKIYLLKSKTVYIVDKANLQTDSTRVNTSFVKIVAGSDSVVMNGTFFKKDSEKRRIPLLTASTGITPEFGYKMNKMLFEWTTSDFTEELLTEYSCKLDGLDEEWSKWEGISYGNTMEAQYSKKEYSNLPYGHYTFRVRTRTLTGLTGNELSYEFAILKPWYATLVAYFGFALVAFLIIFTIIKAYTQKLKNENIRLEGIVVERTAVVVKQKEELESSIHYASRIQMALLPSDAILKEHLKNSFVLFKPRDIVSGDFYWITKKGERLYIVAADCTGHGVPGAFMSLLGMSFLDEIIDKELAPRADQVLHELRLHVTESLKQVGGDDEAKDGMDMALLVIDFTSQRIEYSGAYNPCFRVRKLTDGEIKSYQEDSVEMPDGTMSNGKYLLETIYASKMPIGISSRMNEEFVFNDWALERGISYYMFSDGYIDQFGGPDSRKFMKKNFKKLILSIQDYPMDKQKELLGNNLMEWKGNSPQIDDILVMGIRM